MIVALLVIGFLAAWYVTSQRRKRSGAEFDAHRAAVMRVLPGEPRFTRYGGSKKGLR